MDNLKILLTYMGYGFGAVCVLAGLKCIARRADVKLPRSLRSDAAGYAFFALFGVVIIAVGMSFIIHDRHLLQTGVRATGVVVANDVEHERNGTSYYYPQVRFVGPGKHTYVV